MKLKNPPIVEAVLDIDCDMPRDFDLVSVESEATTLFSDSYPKVRRRVFHEAQFRAGDQTPELTTREGLHAIQLLHDDELQLLQIRAHGFSFNRLAPYTSFDDYIAEIQRAWLLFVGLVAPLRVRAIKLRYINRFLLPLRDGRLELQDYLAFAPRTPDDERFLVTNFFDRRSMLDQKTGELANVVTASQPAEGSALPVILDIEAIRSGDVECANWSEIAHRIDSLRLLKNTLFEESLTKKCLRRFRR